MKQAEETFFSKGTTTAKTWNGEKKNETIKFIFPTPHLVDFRNEGKARDFKL